MAIVKINALADKITCKAGASAECVFDVINATDSKVRVGVETTGELKEKSWTKVQSAVEMDLPPRGQDKIKIGVSIPAGSEAKSYSFKVRVYDVQNPERADESVAVAVTVPAAEKAPDPKPKDPNKKPPWGLIIGGIVGGLVVIGGIVTMLLMMGGGGSVPDLAGLTVDDAIIALQKEDLQLGKVSEQPVAPKEGEVAPEGGQIIAQTPEAKADAPESKTVDVVIAQVTKPVPSVIGLNVPSAEQKLIGDEFTRGEITVQTTGQSPGGTVTGQTPKAGERALPGMPINLVVEKMLVSVPDLKGLAVDQAVHLLDGAGLTRGDTGTANTGAPALTVVDHTPKAGATVDPGTPVNLLIEGKKTEVPDVRNQPLADATTAMTRAGLKVASVGQDWSEPRAPLGTVKAQDPAPGKQVPPGTDVTLVQRVSPPRFGIITAVTLESSVVKALSSSMMVKTAAGFRYVPPEEETEDKQ